jgi:hypothetical protein
MGFEERQKMKLEERMKQKRIEEARKAEAERKQKELAMKNALKCTFNYSEEEYQKAIQKLTDAAWR